MCVCVCVHVLCLCVKRENTSLASCWTRKLFMHEVNGICFYFLFIVWCVCGIILGMVGVQPEMLNVTVKRIRFSKDILTVQHSMLFVVACLLCKVLNKLNLNLSWCGVDYFMFNHACKLCTVPFLFLANSNLVCRF